MTSSKNLMHSNAHIKGYYNVHVGQEFFSSSASWNKILLIALVYHSPPCHGSLLPGKGKLLELWPPPNDDCWTKISVALLWWGTSV